MASMTLIWSFLLFSGTFLVETSAHAPKETTPALNVTTHAPNVTTHAPNVTTHAPNVTTHAPNVTTHAPNVTTHAPNVTTHAPNVTTHTPNVTTHAPNVTTHSPTHTAPTLPPKPSPPEPGNYIVIGNKGEVCIKAIMGLELEIVNSAKEKNTRYLNIDPKHTTQNGTCGDSKSNLLLQFREGSINFIFVKASKTYYIDEVSVILTDTSTGRFNVTSSKLKLLSTDVGYSVKCKRTPSVKLGDNLELILAGVKLQAFEINNNTFGKEEMCSYDRNITAVAIAVVVIVLIVIGIVVYFIWHKRRSSGYQQI
ncbi:lysosome-associated membrane glycoprotein 3 isoform 1-T1 [Leptodactylus fuscus]|uniref:lysosome-associated membrane glycoprotein 3 n=1 Tax=Leptodactylus fuscus TaxID=238119 RepID=UPI003F4EAD1A